MAGYVFAIGKTPDPIDTIRTFAERGIYSTYINSLYPLSFEGTLTDYLSMRPGDNIYFFCKRKFYGIGELVSVGPDCKYCNFPSASKREDVAYDDIKDDLLLDEGPKSPKYRWLCTFRGAPHFFESGVDMDEVLTYKPQTFKMLRAFWKVSFIKLGDEENRSLREIFLLRHQKELATHAQILPESTAAHDALLAKPLTEHTETSLIIFWGDLTRCFYHVLSTVPALAWSNNDHFIFCSIKRQANSVSICIIITKYACVKWFSRKS